MNKMVRKQLFITAEQNKRLKARAAATGVSEAEIDPPRHRSASSTTRWRKRKATGRMPGAKLSGMWKEREDLDEESMRNRRKRGTSAIRSWMRKQMRGK